MAIDTTSHDIFRGTEELVLPTEFSNEVIAQAVKQSAVMQLARRIELPGRGISIPAVVGDVTASIVNEAAEKPVATPEFKTVQMIPKKFAVILPFSNEFKRDANALYNELVRRLPYAISKAFDNQVFNEDAIAGFGSLKSAYEVSPDAEMKTALLEGMNEIASNGAKFNGLAVSPIAEVMLLDSQLESGTPVFVPNYADYGEVGKVFGAPVVESPAVSYFVGGDWTRALWGMVNEIEIAISDQATLNDGTAQINLWQRNMFAVRCEAELSFYADTDAFFKLGEETAGDGE